MLDLKQCDDNECCCKCIYLKQLKSMHHNEIFNVNLWCCTTFAECSDVVVPFKNAHDLCENFTRKE